MDNNMGLTHEECKEKELYDDVNTAGTALTSKFNALYAAVRYGKRPESERKEHALMYLDAAIADLQEYRTRLKGMI